MTPDELIDAADRFVSLGDDPGIFMTCNSGGGEKPFIKMVCQNLEHTQAVYQSLVDIVRESRKLREGE